MSSIKRKALDACLKPEHRQAGYYLEDDEDFLYLKQDGKAVAVWLATVATVPIIQAEVDRLIAEANEK